MAALEQLKGRLRAIRRSARRALQRMRPFPGSEAYWERRYASGGDSGAGSCGKFARFKAEILNAFVRENGVESVIEFGCGDGHQLESAAYPRYLGFDVSPTAVAKCRRTFAGDSTRAFRLVSEYAGETAELALSLDVIYHLVEDDVFEAYMRRLFGAATRFVVIYSSDTEALPGSARAHIRHRRFTRWIERNAPGWSLLRHVPNRYPNVGDPHEGSFADFYMYRRRDGEAPAAAPGQGSATRRGAPA